MFSCQENNVFLTGKQRFPGRKTTFSGQENTQENNVFRSGKHVSLQENMFSYVFLT